MFNLSARARVSSHMPWFWKFQSLFLPEIYLAEDVTDFKREGPKLPFPWYKTPNASYGPCAYIILHNVRLAHMQGEGPEWYVMKDVHALAVVRWESHDGLLPIMQSPEDAAREEAFESGNHVHEVFLSYLIKYDVGHVIEVRKRPRTSRSLIYAARDHSRTFLDIFSPLPLPSYG